MIPVNVPVPPNNVLDPKYNGWIANTVGYAPCTQLFHITLYDPDGPFDSFGPVQGVAQKTFKLDVQSMESLSNAFDWQEYEDIHEKFIKAIKKLAIDKAIPKYNLKNPYKKV